MISHLQKRIIKLLCGSEAAYIVQQTSDSGYIMSGYSSSNSGDVTGNHGDMDYWVVKLYSNGEIEW